MIDPVKKASISLQTKSTDNIFKALNGTQLDKYLDRDTCDALFAHSTLDGLVRDRALEASWRDVFLLLARQMGSVANDLLLALERSASAKIETPSLKKLLIWIAKIERQEASQCEQPGSRAQLWCLALDCAIDCLSCADARTDDLAQVRDYVFLRALALAKASDLAGNLANTRAHNPIFACDKQEFFKTVSANDLTSNLALASQLARDLANRQNAACTDLARTSLARDRDLATALDLAAALDPTGVDVVYFQSDSSARRFLAQVKRLRRRTPSSRSSRRTWIAYEFDLRELFNTTFDRTQGILGIAATDANTLADYFSLVQLIVDCKNVATGVEQQRWEKLSGRLLALPAAEKKREVARTASPHAGLQPTPKRPDSARRTLGLRLPFFNLGKTNSQAPGGENQAS